MNDISYANDHKVVLVTGFGPIITEGVKEVNASGEAVKLIRKELFDNIKLMTRQVPVEYKYVDKNIPRMWQAYEPHLTIHVGISNIAQGFTLETQATKAGYILGDNNKIIPDGKFNPIEGPDVITTDLDVELICKEFNCELSEDDLMSHTSNEAGNYLCEYIYYTSLCQQLNECRYTLLVHVPAMKSQEAFEKLARGLEKLVTICVAQIRSRDTELPLPIDENDDYGWSRG